MSVVPAETQKLHMFEVSVCFIGLAVKSARE
jgi:hypothetical protein